MNFLVIILLGLIQGITEFLPVSSSGHLVLLYDLFGIESDAIILSILLHLATLISVIIYYRKELLTLILHPFCPTNLKMLVTTISTCIVVAIIMPLVEFSFEGEYLFIFFLITAFLLILSDFVSEKNSILSRTNQSKMSGQSISYTRNNITNLNISYKQAIIIGLTQGVACIPGISRSGSTIAVSRLMRCGDDCTTYSFLISIPIILGSLVLELIRGGNPSSINVPALIISIILCSIVGLICIKTMVKFVKNNKLSIFAYYLIFLSIIIILRLIIL